MTRLQPTLVVSSPQSPGLASGANGSQQLGAHGDEAQLTVCARLNPGNASPEAAAIATVQSHSLRRYGRLVCPSAIERREVGALISFGV